MDEGASGLAGVKLSLVPIEELSDEGNDKRVHPERNLALIRQSIREAGTLRSIVTDEAGRILAGKGARLAAQAEGITQVLVIETAGDVLVDHRRRGLTDNQKERARVLDNLSTDTSYFDDTRLGESIIEQPDLYAGIFSQAELDAYVLAAMRAAGRSPLKPDQGPREDVEALGAKWGTATRQVWQIPSLTQPGKRHLLGVGDSRDPDFIAALFGDARARLIVTDPPYGVDYAAKNRRLNKAFKANRNQTPIQGDELDRAATQELITTVLGNLGAVSLPGAGFYIHGPSGDLISAFLGAIAASPFEFHQMLIWYKNNLVLGNADWQNRHEPIFYGWLTGAAHYWDGSRVMQTVLEVDSPRSSNAHPTMKPLELLRPLIEHSTRPGELVADPFAGSGPVAVVCEELGRPSISIEIDPCYGAVILQRLTDLGLSPARVTSDE